MTRKHFEALAAALASTRAYGWRNDERGAGQTWNRTVDAVANVCAAQNDAFDRKRFLAACQEG